MTYPSIHQIKALGVVLGVIVWAIMVNTILLAPLIYVVKAAFKT